MIAIGMTLQPEVEFLDLMGGVLREETDYFQVAPETTWRERPDGELTENGFSRVFRELSATTGKPFVAHGVGFSVGSEAPEDEARRQRWLARLGQDQALFGFRWYTDHLGATALGGQAVTLPIALPMTDHGAATVRRSLAQLRQICPDVGVENSAAYYFVGDARDEPAFLDEALSGPGSHLLLDLHNVLTVAENEGFSPEEYLTRVDLTRVIEIHVSGGSYSDPAWLPGGRVLRLDGHDSAVPDAVFRLLEDVAPRCPNLRGVTLERMEGTVTAADVPVLRDEMRTLRRLIGQLPATTPTASPRPAAGRLPAATGRQHAAYEQSLLRILTAADPGAARAEELAASQAGGAVGGGAEVDAVVAGWLGAIDEAKLRLTALLVARLRFERLLRGCPEADEWFEGDPEDFADAFRDYHASVPLTAFFPGHEARLFRAALAG
jgi:hypothetical protein